jgi:ATP-dependent DNA helicase RecG
MLLRSLNIPINSIKEIRPKDAANFARLGIKTVSDILVFYPRKWEDRTENVPLRSFSSAKVCTVATVISHDWIGYGRKRTLKVYIEDETAQAALLFYNRPWLGKQFVTGNQYMIYGSFKIQYGELQSSAFVIEPVSSKDNFGKIMPVYPLCSGLTQSAVRKITSQIIKKYADNIENELPFEITERDSLMPKCAAIKEIHYPSSMEKVERAKKTLIYEELFYLEIIIGKRSFERRKTSSKFTETKVKKADAESDFAKQASFSALQKRLLERLPFQLTTGQCEAVMEINQDMTGNAPMARLLQGDVGSGKTLVSFLAALKTVEDGGQAAIMAPTELLALQHAENAARFFEPLGLHVAFLTGNVKAKGRKELLKNLDSGEIDIVVGTHALFSKDVIYKNLKLVVIDEQHRFGVTQRSLIMTKGDSPGLLMMSATPIPRTLALTVFGDMDVSVIKDMPPGRKPVKTHLAKESNEEKVYSFIRGELEKGRQAYFVYPLIEGGEDIKDAVSMAERLSKKIFPKYKTALIHSRLTEEEKRQTMDNFRKGDIKILAATSVVEVGVDVPNATCMVIEHAERFGLSALHQLRGRVGRGSEQSFCFLVYSDEYTEDGKTRLMTMLNSNDGFLIAEEDLKLRGPGQIAGTEQSGYLALGLANPIRDFEELKQARADAFAILERDPDLLLENNRVIARVLEEAPPFAGVTL